MRNRMDARICVKKAPGKGTAVPQAPRNPQTRKLQLYAAALALACLPAAAQTAPNPPPAQAPSPAPTAPHNTSVPAFGGQIQSAPASGTTPASGTAPAETPRWPVNQAPTPAAIKWDNQGLQVTAANSSLRQILTEVATRTGARLEGLASDERVFGQYGPGEARDVIAQLLHGSGYNVLLIGDQGQGTPRQIVLSRRSAAAGAQPGASNDSQDSEDDTEPASDDQPEPQPPPPAAQPQRRMPPGAMGPGPRTGVPLQQPQTPQNQQPQ
jgi:hypothetical protein